MKPANKSVAIAYSSITVALGVCIMYVLGATGIGMYVGPLIASVGVKILAEEYGDKYGILCYIATAVISFIIIPDKELCVFYLTFAWYPMILKHLRKIDNKAIRIVIKLLLLAAIITANILILMTVLGLDISILKDNPLLYGIELICFGICFMFLDTFYTRWYKFYKRTVKRSERG
jgi:MFS family permease